MKVPGPRDSPRPGTFQVLLRQLSAPAGEGEARLPERAAKRLGCPAGDIVSWRILRRSLDARKRSRPVRRVYHLRLELPDRLREAVLRLGDPEISIEEDPAGFSPDGEPPPPPPPAPGRLLVAGAGPAGLFAALRLARAGLAPLLIDRGDGLEDRRGRVAEFWGNGVLDPESNALFGLGGAGLFSDGKLNTRHRNRAALAAILGILAAAGAPPDILVEAEPHVGSDRLGEVVERIAAEITGLGGAVRCRTRLEGLDIRANRLRAVLLAGPGGSEELAVSACLLAIGHSARDTQEMLVRAGVRLAAKPFAIGLRAEMPQSAIDRSQGRPAAAGAASFRLARKPGRGTAACYSFCMCPGGRVIACASEPERLCVNGMSFRNRDGEWGNAAFLSPVGPEDFAPFRETGLSPALAGAAFQRHWEGKAWRAGASGGPYAVPACRLGEFVRGERPTLPARRGLERAAAADLRPILPERTVLSLAEAIPALLGKLRRVNLDEVVLYGIETRTSSPVRMLRTETGEAEGTAGLYPAGEGSGQAGGIMTSALDGWLAAGKILAALNSRKS